MNGWITLCVLGSNLKRPRGLSNSTLAMASTSLSLSWVLPLTALSARRITSAVSCPWHAKPSGILPKYLSRNSFTKRWFVALSSRGV